MNILVLNYEYPPLGGGAAPVSRDISRQLVKRGHHVVVVTMGYKNLPDYEIDEGVEVYRVKCWRKKSFSCMPWEQFTYLLSVRRFMRKHKELQKYDICHTHFVIPTAEVSRWIFKKYHIPYVITAHGSDVEGYNSKKYMKVMHVFLRPFWKAIVRGAYRVISPSFYLEDLMKKAYDIPNKYLMIPNGIALLDYQQLYTESSEKKKKILIMGRMQKYKNVQTTIMALSKVDLEDWVVDILGDGPYRNELENLTKELHLENKVTFHGWIENKSSKQLQFLKEASIYITASKFENCPMAVIETASAGCYMLVSDISAHRQILSGEEHFFEPDNVDQLAEKIERQIRIGARAYEYDFARYDWNNVMPQYEKVLSEVVKSGVKR